MGWRPGRALNDELPAEPASSLGLTPTTPPPRHGDAHRQTNRHGGDQLRSISKVTARVLLCYAIVAVIVPLDPSMPAASPESGWRVAVNRALADHLVFGRDFVFTYGPYGGVLTGVYEPTVRTLILTAAVVFAAAYGSALLTAFWDAGTTMVAVVSLGILTMGPLNVDGLALIFPMVMTFSVHRLGWTGFPRYLALGLYGLALSLLPFTKVSVLPAVIVGEAACLYLLLRRRDLRGFATMAAVSCAGVIGWWVAAWQPLTALPTYITRSLNLIEGYSAAMSLHDSSRLSPGTVTVLFGLSAATVLVTTAVKGQRGPLTRVELLMTALTLFLVFKAGFVRSDQHMAVGPLGILVAWALVVRGLTLSRRAVAVLNMFLIPATILCFLATTLISPIETIKMRTTAPLTDFVHGRLGTKSLDRSYEAAMARIRGAFLLPKLDGTADLYPASLNVLLAQRVVWQPRPVVQSYAAYDAELASLNAKHVQGPHGPQSLLFKIRPVDQRLPALEDGPSWRPLLERYRLEGESSGYLYLHRLAVPRQSVLGEVHAIEARLGETVRIPAGNAMQLATVDLTPTLVGHLRNVVWKLPELRIDILTADGSTHVRRFVAAMAGSEFLVSPYVQSTGDFAELFGQHDPDPAHEVVAVKIRLEKPHWPGAALSWSSTYHLRLRSMKIE